MCSIYQVFFLTVVFSAKFQEIKSYLVKAPHHNFKTDSIFWILEHFLWRQFHLSLSNSLCLTGLLWNCVWKWNRKMKNYEIINLCLSQTCFLLHTKKARRSNNQFSKWDGKKNCVLWKWKTVPILPKGSFQVQLLVISCALWETFELIAEISHNASLKFQPKRELIFFSNNSTRNAINCEFLSIMQKLLYRFLSEGISCRKIMRGLGNVSVDFMEGRISNN